MMREKPRKYAYYTLEAEAETRTEIKKSVFISVAAPAKDGLNAELLLSRRRAQHPDAGHHVSAWRVGSGSDMKLERYSDDGEPSGTAGLPILSVLKNRKIENACVVVTRYFGGTLLGTGGLVRAYTQAAEKAIEAARITQMLFCKSFEIEIAYHLYAAISKLCEERKWLIIHSVFLETVQLKIAVPLEEENSFISQLADFTSGSAIARLSDSNYIPFNR